MDPALWELLRSSERRDDEEVEAIVRLDRPHMDVEGLRIISRFGPIATCRFEKRRTLQIHEEENVLSLKAGRLFRADPLPQENAAGSAPQPFLLPGDIRRPPGLDCTGAGTVIAFADWGCDFDHPDFKNEDGTTRLLALWDQRGKSPPGKDNRYGYGAIHTHEQINHALRSGDPYRRLNYYCSDADQGDSGAHGTHVMGIAAGNGRGGGPLGMAPEARLIFVHLAIQGISGLANLGDSVRILEAIDFIARTAGDRPLVINLSVGEQGGPHDGKTLCEMAFDYFLNAAPNRLICQSTGNYYDRGIHACGSLRAGEERSLHVLVDPEDITPNELEIWYSGQDDFDIRVVSPTGTLSRWVGLGEDGELIEGGELIGRLYNRACDPNNTDNQIECFLYTSAPPGEWQVILRGIRVVSGSYHAWIERDDTCPHCQARFIPSDQDPYYTTGTLANGHLSLVAGAYDAHSPSRLVSHFSSAGPTRDDRIKPDCVAPGQQVLSTRSAPAGYDSSPGLYIRKSGSSMAAPHFTGLAALCFQAARRPLWSHEVRALILENLDPAPVHSQSALRYGAGYMNVLKTVAAAADPAWKAKASQPPGIPGYLQSSLAGKEVNMYTEWTDELLEKLDQIITSVENRLDSERKFLARILGFRGAQVQESSLDPNRLYRQLLSGPRLGEAEAPDGAITVLARPGEAPLSPPRDGDVLLRVTPGWPSLGHAALIRDATLWPHTRLAAAPFGAEAVLPGFYAQVVEPGAFPHSSAQPYGRLVLDRSGRMPPGQMLLRIPQLETGQVMDEAEYEGEEWPEDLGEGEAAARANPVDDSRLYLPVPAQVPVRAARKSESEQAAESPPTAVPDPLLAVPSFSAQARAIVSPLLTPAESQAAIRWNARRHPAASGLEPADLLVALQQYVDLAAVQSAIDGYNAAHPSAPVAPGSAPVDRLFVEAVHQFQSKCYQDSHQRDGLAGSSVLDSLGFWPRKGLLSQAETNDWAQDWVKARRKKIDEALAVTPADFARGLTAASWWDAFVNPAFLGWAFQRPIHVYLARKLRQAEQWLLGQARFAGKTPVELAALLDIQEKHAGGRASAGSKSIHTTGLAIDIQYSRNPHVGDYRDKPVGAARFSQVIKRAAAKISNVDLGVDTFPQYLDQLGSDENKTTAQIYTELARRDQDLRQYLAMPGTSADRSALETGVFLGSVARDPRNGFLNLDEDLVIALRDQACLVWGAVDFGPKASGDIMHFDCRLDALGRAVYCGSGGTFNIHHPCWRRPEVPCPDESSSSRARVSHPGTLAEYWPGEDDIGLRTVFNAQDAEPDEAFWMEYLPVPEDDPQATPPRVAHKPSADPPGETILVTINLGKDVRCVKKDEKRNCIEWSKPFQIRPETGIFLPENYVPDPRGNVDLILYLHGHKTDTPGCDALISEYWDGVQFPELALREEINASRKNVILVAPTLGLLAEPGDLARGKGLDSYLEQVLAALAAYGPFGGRSLSIGSLVIAAHSGGGVTMRKLALSGSQAADKIVECWGLDSLYNSGDVEHWLSWAKSHSSAQLFSYYYTDLPTDNSKELAERAGKRKLSNIHTQKADHPDLARQERVHFKLVRVYLRERLRAANFFQDIPAKSAVPARRTGESEEEGFGESTGDLAQVMLLHDDLQTPVGQDEIIGLDGDQNLNILAAASLSDASALGTVSLDLVVRTPGKAAEKIVTRALKVPRLGVDPHNADQVLFRLSVALKDIGKIFSALDGVREIATVRRVGGTSDVHLLRGLGSGWKLRGQAEQAQHCGMDSGSLADERPDALKLLQAGGVSILELIDSAGTKRIKRFIRNPADIFYYTGHGLGRGFSRRVASPTLMNCLAIEDLVSEFGYCCWASPADLLPFWKSPMDLDVLIIAGCSLLAVDATHTPLSGDGLEWARLLQPQGGPLKYLLGYGDWDENEEGGPMGATAPEDSGGGDEIAGEIGRWIKAHPDLEGLITQWLSINMEHQNPFSTGFDKDGFCWRTRRKHTSGWTVVQDGLLTKDKIRYVIENHKVI